MTRDPLSAARGIIIGFALSLVAWALVGFAAWQIALAYHNIMAMVGQ